MIFAHVRLYSRRSMSKLSWLLSLPRYSLQKLAVLQVLVFQLLLPGGESALPKSTCDGVHLNITANLGVHGILEMDSSSQTVTLKLGFQASWRDKRLAYSVKNGEEKLRYRSSSHVCFPDLVIDESLDSSLIYSTEQDVMIQHDGTVFHEALISYAGHCAVDVSYYPFDTQLCNLTVHSLGHSTDTLGLHASPRHQVGVDQFRSHGEWRLTDVTTAQFVRSYTPPLLVGGGDGGDIRRQYLVFAFRLSRNPNFYLINLVLPSTIVTVEAVIGLFTPASTNRIRQNKSQLGIVALVSMAVQLVSIASTLPVVSEEIPLLSKYNAGLFIVIGLSTITANVLVFYQYTATFTGNQPPNWLQDNKYTANAVDSDCNSVYNVSDTGIADGDDSNGSNGKRRRNRVTPVNLVTPIDKKSHKMEDEQDWSRAMLKLDKIFMALYLVIVAAMLVLFLGMGYGHQMPDVRFANGQYRKDTIQN